MEQGQWEGWGMRVFDLKQPHQTDLGPLMSAVPTAEGLWAHATIECSLV